MKNRILALSLLIVSLVPRSAGEAHPAPVRLTVSVFNDVAASPSVMSQAQIRATSILRRAGISLIWLDCGTPGNPPPISGCSDLSFPQHLSVRLVSTSAPVSEDIFGQAFQDSSGEGNYALVYYRALASSNAASVVKTGDFLGFVIAHELGHLLLGRDSHSATGLMAAIWQATELRQASQGILFFTNDQQGRIRERCLAAQAAVRKAASAPSTGSGK